MGRLRFAAKGRLGNRRGLSAVAAAHAPCLKEDVWSAVKIIEPSIFFT
jgi:hypothetical protein